ncbi:Conserved in the green lineage and diatoms 27 protein [Thalictrum thalictroides]|uniref:Conserved in the green lineage and diatoms 27 protein n=1 Tax=Thalictrum thalictroides TaxID=46969 RepID=A0A7J6VXB8_THATH|nr:Conserved in the green lineage and diatoms 27 protein [Thalictrum thalictroides]
MATTATTLSLLSPKTIFLHNPISIIKQTRFISILHRHKSKTITFSSSKSSSFTSPEAECPVPFDQQPINEYQSLSTSFPFSWAATNNLVEYSSRLIATGASFALFIGLPVAWFGVINPQLQPLKCGVGALSSGLFVVTLAVLHMYLGWAYVGNRLLSATVEYEETGWYDGQIWIKSAQVLARDRLLGSYSVKPVLSRLKFTLVGLATSLVVCVFLFINIEEGQQKSYIPIQEPGGRSVAGVYNDDSARLFEPDDFCGEPSLQ